MYMKRTLATHVVRMAEQFPVIAIMGPRQSGKTTLAQKSFPEYTYVSLEDLDRQAFAKEDPCNDVFAHTGYQLYGWKQTPTLLHDIYREK